jgi:ABC-type transport system substrate-binding protein
MRHAAMGSLLFVLLVCGWRPSLWAAPASAPRGEIRIVDSHPWNWIYITLNVFEHLMELDKNGKLVPRLAQSWRWLDDRTLEVVLRQGVRFHNGEVFDAGIVKLNWEENIRTRQPHVLGHFMTFKAGSRMEIVDPNTVRFVFPEPDGGALIKLSFMHIGNRAFYRAHGWGEKHW